ncbi:hypothetical protein N7539_008948 [Penicillium diatomitis]|uniref:Conidiation-specific protein 6 n=1 Tax=Penicillium diatomitis TaxID=2819901 RepID=A0A9W9WKU3_9EURO|nr:uncharacterized protein N7539_008948 [Penicillium diatomitis]KAJ5469330.1 hypothetical protein N7539_008948 [Penicillium diatomitis]
MARHTGSEENRLRGYKAAAHNLRNSTQARTHAQEEANKLSAEYEHEPEPVQAAESSEEEEQPTMYSAQHERNVKRGLKAAVHNTLVSEGARQNAQRRLDEM